MKAIRFVLGMLVISIGLFVLSNVVGFIESRGVVLLVVSPGLLSLAGWITLGLFMLFVLAIAVEWTSQGVEPRR